MRSDFHDEVDTGGLVDLQYDPAAVGLLEAGGFGDHRIRARSQRQGEEASVRAGYEMGDYSRIGVDHLDLHTGHDGAAGVFNIAFEAVIIWQKAGAVRRKAAGNEARRYMVEPLVRGVYQVALNQ